MKRLDDEEAARGYRRLFPPSSLAGNIEGSDGGRKPGGWRTMPYIIGNETFERVASFGMTTNLTVYLVKQYNMGAVTAANLTNIWNGTANFAPLIGAFLSDAFLGRFSTIFLASIFTILGMAGMTFTASIPELRPPPCNSPAAACAGPTAAQTSMLVTSLALLAIGAGGIRPCNLPFGVDQFDRTTENDRKKVNSFFNWYYATNTAAVMAALTLVVYLQNSVSWVVGMAVPAVLMLFSLLIFLLGARLYVFVPPEGSVFSGIIQVFVAAFNKRSLRLPSPEEQEALLFNPPQKSADKLPLTQQFKALNRAAIKLPEEEGAANPWRLSTVQRIEEAKCLIRILPIWVSGITCFLALSQLWTFAVVQAFFMDCHVGNFQIPPASLGSVTLFSIVVFLPIYDRVFVPLLRRVTKVDSGITLLQRMGIGNTISPLSIVVAGVVEVKRRRAAAIDPIRPISVFWLVPQLALVGLAEAFSAVAMIEFFNEQFPDQMRSVATSLFYCSIAAANYLSSLIVAAVKREKGSWLAENINEGRLENFYFLLAALGFGNFVYFLFCARLYRYKGAV